MLPVPAFRAAILLVVLGVMSPPLAAQISRAGTVAAIRSELPSPVAEEVLTRIALAEAQGVAAPLLELHALELAAKDVPSDAIIRGVERHAERLGRARQALVAGGRHSPDAAETAAAELAMKQGVDGAAVSTLARSAPEGGSLAVPLLALSSLMHRGLPSDQAIARVQALIAVSPAHAPSLARPAHAGRPDAIPANGGRGNRPDPPGRR